MIEEIEEKPVMKNAVASDFGTLLYVRFNWQSWMMVEVEIATKGIVVGIDDDSERGADTLGVKSHLSAIEVEDIGHIYRWG